MQKDGIKNLRLLLAVANLIRFCNGDWQLMANLLTNRDFKREFGLSIRRNSLILIQETRKTLNNFVVSDNAIAWFLIDNCEF